MGPHSRRAHPRAAPERQRQRCRRGARQAAVRLSRLSLAVASAISLAAGTLRAQSAGAGPAARSLDLRLDVLSRPGRLDTGRSSTRFPGLRSYTDPVRDVPDWQQGAHQPGSRSRSSAGSRGRNALIGAAVGAGVGLAAGLAIVLPSANEESMVPPPFVVIGATLIGTTLGALIGVLVPPR